MGLLTLVEDRPTPSQVYNWRVYACAAIASFASAMIGYDSAFIGTTIALPSFVSEFGWDTYEAGHLALVQANIVSVYQAGAFFGALFAYGSAYYIGRRYSLHIFSLIFILGAGIMLGANAARGTGLILGGRVLAGVGVGGTSMIVPIYISELSPPAIRGRLVGIYELGWQIGGLVGFWINYGLTKTMPPSHKQWIIPFAVQLIPAGLLLIGALWIKESPRWLLTKGRREQALKNLTWIRNIPADHIYLVEEVAYIDAAIEEQRQGLGTGFWKVSEAKMTYIALKLTINSHSFPSPEAERSSGDSSSVACSSSSRTAVASTPSTITRRPSSSPSVSPVPARDSSPLASSVSSRLPSPSSGCSYSSIDLVGVAC